MTSPLIHGLFKSIFFHFQIFENFLDTVLLLISDSTSLWLEALLHKIFIHYNLLNLYSTSQNVVCAGECYIYTWEQCVFSCYFSWYINIRSLWLTVLFKSIFLLIVFPLRFISYRERDVIVSNYVWRSVYF